MEINPQLRPIAFLLGTWRGRGRGVYPTIEPFEYDEEITIEPLGPKPMLRYSQLTWRADTDDPLHSEVGFFRPIGETAAEMVVAQPTGITEIHAGTVEGSRMELRSTAVERAPTAVEVRSVERRIEVSGDRLTYDLSMGAVGQPHQLHLEATLDRVRLNSGR